MDVGESAERAARGKRARTRARAGAAILLLAVLAWLAAAAPASARRLPPIPACFETGSGFFTCDGNIIPAGGTIVAVQRPNAGLNRYKLTGPAPLQSTKPVACGDEGCVYNHLDWYVGIGASVASGCGTNQTVCVVVVPPGSTQWVPVYVRQNNDPKLLYALWNPNCTVADQLAGTCPFHISGNVYDKDSGKAVKGATVRAACPGGGTTKTDSEGYYEFTLDRRVDRGACVVSVPPGMVRRLSRRSARWRSRGEAPT